MDPVLTPEQQIAQDKLMRELTGGRPKAAPPPAPPAEATPRQVEKQSLGSGLLRSVLGKRERDAGL